MVPATVPCAASKAVASPLRPLNVNTRPEARSYRIASGFSPVLTSPILQAPRRRIEGEIVPAAVAPQPQDVDHPVPRRCRGGGRKPSPEPSRQDARDDADHGSLQPLKR